MVLQNEELSRETLRSGLSTIFIGQELHVLKEVTSTNQVAAELADEDAPEGTVVIAEEQKKGRGRRGRSFMSPVGGAYVSVVLRPSLAYYSLSHFTLISGVAACQAIDEVTGGSSQIKWPNDVLINDRKVAGILIESRFTRDVVEYMVLGIGINVNTDADQFPEDVRSIATSLKMEFGREFSRTLVIQKLLESLERYYIDYMERGVDRVYDEWIKRNSTLGRQIKVQQDQKLIEGKAVRLETDGSLVVKTEEGLTKITAGDVIEMI